ncbi:hypothetical protein Tco_0122609 [Tanacetum coccineum]
MAKLSEDIQCAGSDTRPPMLDRTDFVSWQTTDIRCIGVKRNGHEAHFGANENKIGCWNDSLNTVDPLALMSNVAPQQYNSHSSTNPSSNRYMVFGRAQILSLGNANPGHASKLSATTATENGVALDEEQLLFLADPVYDESGPSYDSDILSKEVDIIKKTKNQSKSNKTGHGMEKCVKAKPNQSQVYSEKKKAKKNIT